MPFFVLHRNSPPPVVEINVDSERALSRSSSRREKLRLGLVHISRYFSRPRSTYSTSSLLSTSVSSRNSDTSTTISFDLQTGEKVVCETRTTTEGFTVISKRPAAPILPTPLHDKFAKGAAVGRSLSNVTRRGTPPPPPTLAQITALRIYAEKALPPLPPKSRPTSVLLSITPPTDSIPAPISAKAKSGPSAFTTPTKPKRGSLRPRTPKSPNNTDSFLSFSATPPQRTYSFRTSSILPKSGSAIRTSFLSFTSSPSPSPPRKISKPTARYSTTSERMGFAGGATLPPGRVELRVAELPTSMPVATRPTYRHPYATAVPAVSSKNSRRHN